MHITAVYHRSDKEVIKQCYSFSLEMDVLYKQGYLVASPAQLVWDNGPRAFSGRTSKGARPVLLQSLLHTAVTKVVAGFV